MKDINAMTVIALSLVKISEKVDFELKIPRFGVLVLKYSTYNAVFILTRFFPGPKNRVKEESLYIW